jgi:hypothetical protein
MAASTRGLISEGPGPIKVRCGGWKEVIFFAGSTCFILFTPNKKQESAPDARFDASIIANGS